MNSERQPRSASLPRLVSLALLLGFCGCGPSEAWEDASCPPEGTKLGYDSFGRGFIGKYCQSCHAQNATDRRGAPAGFSFDTLEDIRRHQVRIYQRSAGDNVSMPPGPDDPPLELRDDLAEWLACEAPQ